MKNMEKVKKFVSFSYSIWEISWYVMDLNFFLIEREFLANDKPYDRCGADAVIEI